MSARTKEELLATALGPEASDIRAVPEEEVVGVEFPNPDTCADPLAKKKRGGHALVKTETLGDNPRLRRAAIRATLRPGHNIGSSGKRAIRTLHRLGLLRITRRGLSTLVSPEVKDFRR